MSKFSPTAEQVAALDAFKGGGNGVLDAFAGAGKTSTLKLLANATSARGVYVAYNRSIADEAGREFPSNVTARTMHSFAFRAVGKRYGGRLKGPRVTSKQVAKILSLWEPRDIGNDLSIAPHQQARLVMDAIRRFCYSADDSPMPRHVPYVPGATDEGMDSLRGFLAPYVREAWADLQQTHGALKFEHDHYLKMFQLQDPRLEGDFIMLDEAQDANPCVAAIVNAQDHAQRVLVGDPFQQIYAWRGAVDAMATFPADWRLPLSQSFRFGDAIAVEANKWLALLDSERPLRGFDAIESSVEPVADPRAILCRTNAGVIENAMDAMESGKSFAIVGGTGEIKRFAEAAESLMRGAGCWHPELSAFQTWQQLCEYANDDGAGGLGTLVRLVNTHGVDLLTRLADAATSNEDAASVTLSTAHKAKGREWDSVRIGGDFARDREDGETGKPSTAEMNLAYVSVTRAQRKLDNFGLAWVDQLA